jgi:hypothetical protein
MFQSQPLLGSVIIKKRKKRLIGTKKEDRRLVLQNKRNNMEQNFEASLAIIKHQSVTIIIKTNIEQGTVTTQLTTTLSQTNESNLSCKLHPQD